MEQQQETTGEGEDNDRVLIPVFKSTWRRLVDMKNFGDSFDDIINGLMDINRSDAERMKKPISH